MKTSAAGIATVEEVRFSSLALTQQVLPLRRNQQLLAPLLAQMPAGGISEFFGVCKGRFKSANVVQNNDLIVHLYAIPTGKRKLVEEGGNEQTALFLDLFTRANTKPPAQLRRLNRIALTQELKCVNGNWAHGSDSVVGVDLMWIDSRQQIPVLKLRMSGTVISGIAGCYGLIIFPKGLRAKAIIQDFETHDQMMGGMTTFFSDRDKRGFLVVRQEIKSYDMDFDKRKTTEKLLQKTYFNWNGKAFIARPSRSSR